MAKYTEAQARAVKKHLATLDEYKVRMEKGKKAEYMEEAKKRGMSLNVFILEAIEEKIARES